MRIKAGEMNRVVRFEGPIKTQLPSGGFGEVFEELFTVRGKWTEDGGSRGFSEGQDLRIKTFTLYTYWRHAIETAMNKDVRVVIDDNTECLITHWEKVEGDRMYMKFELLHGG